MNKRVIAVGLVVTLLLAALVGGLYFYAQKRMQRDSASRLAAAQALYEAQQWSQAEALFSEIAKRYPRSDAAPEGLRHLALIMQSGGKYNEALATWQSLEKIKNNPHAVETDYYIANCLENLGKKAEALPRYSRIAAMPQAGEFASLAKSGLGRIAESEGKLEEARTRYEEATAQATTPQARDLAEQLLGNLNLQMFLVPVEDENKKAYLVKRGDSMVQIALREKTTIDLLCAMNGISDPAQLKPSKRIVIPHAEFSILIDKSDFKLTLNSHGKFFKSYKVGLGKHGCTPVGEFVIDQKERNPRWWSNEGPVEPGDPRNELGTRWMRLKPLTPNIGTDYGIHGTINPATIGWESSNGCPRMYPAEAEELFMLVSEGTPVTIVQ
jgi:lipoprotein-anchoring transpeptidase ErfK/SrfK